MHAATRSRASARGSPLISPTLPIPLPIPFPDIGIGEALRFRVLERGLFAEDSLTLVPLGGPCPLDNHCRELARLLRLPGQRRVTGGQKYEVSQVRAPRHSGSLSP